MRLLMIFVGLMAVLSISFGYSLAASTAELSRSSTIQVDSDTDGIITITPNPEFEIIQADPQLSITPENIPADSVNNNSQITLGDTTAPSQSEAFTITNSSTQPIELTISLESTDSFDGTSDSVVYYIETETGVEQVQVGETTQVELDASEELFIAVEMTADETETDISTIVSLTGESI